MLQAIVYTSNAGSAARYAKMLAQATGLPVCALAEARRGLAQGAEIIYVGWIMASCVKGYAAAAKRFCVRAVCGVGMAQTGTQIDGAVGMNSGIFNNPFIIWGRYRKGLFKTTLPISFQFHHTQMDGAHAGRFLQLVQESIDALRI